MGTNSDNGTATTSSTECSNFESEDVNHPQQNLVQRERRHSTDDNLYSVRPSNKAVDYVSNLHFDPSMSLSPGSSYVSASENRRRRQESLV